MSAFGRATEAAVRSYIYQVGESATLRRLTGTQQIPMSVELRAVIGGAAEQQMAGSAMQMDRQVIISNHEIAAKRWPGPPRRGDRLIAGRRSYTVEDVDTIVVDDVTVQHELRVRGGPSGNGVV